MHDANIISALPFSLSFSPSLAFLHPGATTVSWGSVRGVRGVVGLVCSCFRVRLFLFLVDWVVLCWLMLYLIWVRSSCAVVFMALISAAHDLLQKYAVLLPLVLLLCTNSASHYLLRKYAAILEKCLQRLRRYNYSYTV